MYVLFVLSLFLCQSWSQNTNKLELVLLTGNARCLDGSPSGFYYNLGSGSGVNAWMFYLEGGGYCNSKESCTQRADSNLGSSKNWTQTHAFVAPFQNRNQTTNPLSYNWNYIYVPYCGGDVHSGQRTNATDETWGLYFSGHVTIEVLIQGLVSKYNFANAVDVLISGGSAGGFGTFVNLDYIASFTPKAKIRGAPDAGYFISVPTYPGSGYPTLSDVLVEMYPISLNYYNQQCGADHPDRPTDCVLPNVQFPYLKTPVFVVESQTDTNQIFTQDGCPQNLSDPNVQAYIISFGQQMLQQAQQLIASPTTGLFMPACLIHGVDMETVIVDGTNAYDVIVPWYLGTSSQNITILDNCPTFNCNPSCNTSSSSVV